MSEEDKIRRFTIKKALEDQGLDSSGLSIEESATEQLKRKLHERIKKQNKQKQELILEAAKNILKLDNKHFE